MLLYMVWPYGHRIVWPGGPRKVYSMAWPASHDIMVWSGVSGMGYGMALRVSHL